MSAADPRRSIPRTDALLADPALAGFVATLGRERVKAAVLAAQSSARSGSLAPDDVLTQACSALARLDTRATTLTRVINATGVVIHTNLGRAPLTDAAQRAMLEASAYVDVEFDLATGVRARRGRGTIDALLDAVPAASGALVVNNGAAALSLAATVLAQGREVIVSRGEMVEIGDGFRLPDLIRATGVTIHEVGTTNRTHVADYERAVNERTGAILKIHPSNFVVAGFTSSVSVSECAKVAAAARISLVVDIGSGLLAPDSVLPDEPDAQSVLAAGADLVTASGDKLLGGPQAGIILGRAALVERLRRHPLARAFRTDKVTLAALEATLRGPRAAVLDYLHLDAAQLAPRVHSLRAALGPLADSVGADVVPVVGAVGGGGGPGVPLAGWALALPEDVAPRLRAGRDWPVPVIARVEAGRTLVDLRCVPPDRDVEVADAVRAVLGARARLDGCAEAAR